MITQATAHYTDAQLRTAWRACRLHNWPGTFEETMADPIRERLVRLNAWHFAHPLASALRHGHPPRALPAFHLKPPPGYVDLKRAAAGDRDDD